MHARAISRSRTCRAMGPSTIISWIDIGRSFAEVERCSGMRPSVGRIAVVPQHWEGHLSEPPMSCPSPSGVMPVASATASPPLEPPGVSAGSQGFRVSPRRPLPVCQRRPISGMFVRPMGIAPATFNCPTCGESMAGMIPSMRTTPCVVAEPTTSMFSFAVKGTPWSGPGVCPAASARSASSAAASACSASTTVTALTALFTCSIRSRCACTTSRLFTSRLRIALARSAAPRRQSSCSIGSSRRLFAAEESTVSVGAFPPWARPHC